MPQEQQSGWEEMAKDMATTDKPEETESDEPDGGSGPSIVDFLTEDTPDIDPDDLPGSRAAGFAIRALLGFAGASAKSITEPNTVGRDLIESLNEFFSADGSGAPDGQGQGDIDRDL